MTWRWIFLKSRKFISGLCVTLPTLRMTAYYFEERNFITAHLILTQYSVLRLKYGIIPVLLTLIYFLIFIFCSMTDRPDGPSKSHTGYLFILWIFIKKNQLSILNNSRKNQISLNYNWRIDKVSYRVASLLIKSSSKFWLELSYFSRFNLLIFPYA